MVYGNFKQEATIFKVHLIPKPDNNLCVPPNNGNIQEPYIFFKQEIDLVFVSYEITQYTFQPDIKLIPCYYLDPQPLIHPNLVEKDPKKIVKSYGYYVLTIIPTQVLYKPSNTIKPCFFDKITPIGLYYYYIYAGFYACKPLEYKSQCETETINGGLTITEINKFYILISHRLSALYPFFEIFAFNKEMRRLIKQYKETATISCGTVIEGPEKETLRRSLSDIQSDVTDNTDTLLSLKRAIINEDEPEDLPEDLLEKMYIEENDDNEEEGGIDIGKNYEMVIKKNDEMVIEKNDEKEGKNDEMVIKKNDKMVIEKNDEKEGINDEMFIEGGNSKNNSRRITRTPNHFLFSRKNHNSHQKVKTIKKILHNHKKIIKTVKKH